MTAPPDRRFPRFVYGRGSEPDARFSLSNEQTFLSWVRIGLALLAGGVALEALDLHLEPHLRLTAAVLLIALGIATPVQAWFGWARVERAMRERRPLPAPALSGPLAAGVAVAGVLVLLGLLLR
ncbi:DUF202 domain-containing protein [Cellulomonas hominis]|uniref:DUF202 domain-containing protein n=1 Tax=Cellulomonas hominis TaxID=156981 RepID=A0A7Z8JXA4_9CELL|nr:DUF202 domain-containing protein [Cellulomonas hominis]TKR21986.1 DUF202 domain-containing protein [Cellulomonas hominis]